MFKNLFKKSYTSINTNDHGSAGVSRAESAKADKRAAEAAQEKPEKIPSRPTAMTPESLRSLWRKCNKCEKPILVQDVKDNLYVCPRCGGYFRMHAYRRIEMLIDEGTFEEWDKEMSVVNPLAFPGYEGKVEAAREKTELNEAVVTGKGKIHGYETVIAVCDSRFLMSSMGHNMGEKIARAVERATEERLPVIIYAASGGARMQEGMISLMQMAKTSAALKRHSEAGLLYISFMTDPTTGGVTASFASLGDIILAEPGALIGFAGPRVIEQTIGQKLPEGFQRAEFQLTHGFVDQIVERKDQKRVLGQILKLHSQEHGWEKWNDEAENHTEAASASKAEKAASVEEGKLKSRKAPFSGIMRQKTLNKIAGRERDAWEAVRQSRSAGTWRRFKHPRLRSKPSVSWFGVVVSVMTEEPITRYIRRRPMKTASRKPSCVTFKNPIWKITRPFVKNRLKLILISNRNTIALSPRTINLNGTREARTAIARNTVAAA